ncbi:MAG: hypothetical protein KDA75_08955 [Planctomycetaceae bacterium]|nr:hypothetical protein [Planctomycetaceae bacterium]
MEVSESCRDDTPLDAAILDWLTQLSDQWLAIEVLALSSKKSLALHACVQSGLVELQIPCTAWGADRRDCMRGTFFVTGGWNPSDLTNCLRHHFAGWSQQPVSIQQDVRQSARLTDDGKSARQDAMLDEPLLRLTAIQSAKGRRPAARIRFSMDLGERAATATASAHATASTGDVIVNVDLGSLQERASTSPSPMPSHSAPPDRSSRTRLTKKQQIDAWLNEYLLEHQPEYDQLLPLIAIDKEAQRRFRSRFGPTPLARQFARDAGADGDGKQIESNKTLIQGSPVYQTRIKPVLHGQQPLNKQEHRRRRSDEALCRGGL